VVGWTGRTWTRRRRRENQATAWTGQEEDTDTGEEISPDREAVLAEREISCLTDQFPQAALELAESWDGSEGGERLGIGQGLEVTSQSGKEGQTRPPTEADRLLQEEEEKERTLSDWRSVEEAGVQQEEEEEDLDEPSPLIKEEWRSRRYNPWDTQDSEWLRAQLYAPRKEQIAVRCVLEHHLKVWKETCGEAAFMEKLPPAYERPLRAR
jgi:hypothetical protein